MFQGDNIKELRRREGLTQHAFASIIGVSKETVCRWEKGRTSVRPSTLNAISERFGVSFDDLGSEQHGLAAAESHNAVLDCTADDSPDDERAVFKIAQHNGGANPLLRIGTAPVPASIASKHPGCFFVQMNSLAMSRCYPQGAFLLVDPALRPWNGCSVIALSDTSNVVIRRYSKGNNTIILSSHSYRTAEPDIVLDRRRIRVLGVIVWFQASHDLAGQ